jgi:hypothetical protein
MTAARPAHTNRRGWLTLAVLSLALGACVAPATQQVTRVEAAPPPTTQVYFYPTRGQSAQQQDRDRYECYLWSVKQTGFDPSRPNLAPHQRFNVVVTSPPPGYETSVGAATGAVLGAVVSRPGREAEGAAVGAIAGAMVGAASEAARQQETERARSAAAGQRDSHLEQQAANYRRAMTACLEGRGYTVK